jgi:TRAP-type C4-dicarboxylate transport system substrate-binding protein
MSNRKCAGLTICILIIVCLCFSTSAFGQARPIELTYTTHMPARHGVTLMSMDWAKEVEKKTNGRVKVTVLRQHHACNRQGAGSRRDYGGWRCRPCLQAIPSRR